MRSRLCEVFLASLQHFCKISVVYNSGSPASGHGSPTILPHPQHDLLHTMSDRLYFSPSSSGHDKKYGSKFANRNQIYNPPPQLPQVKDRQATTKPSTNQPTTKSSTNHSINQQIIKQSTSQSKPINESIKKINQQINTQSSIWVSSIAWQPSAAWLHQKPLIKNLKLYHHQNLNNNKNQKKKKKKKTTSMIQSSRVWNASIHRQQRIMHQVQQILHSRGLLQPMRTSRGQGSTSSAGAK
ncbi:hypothetical protein B0J12DRAFT_452353 [Macrophomina phaseolina]|uniref:Uncharacterized protein n=1 Tax=Macrophomina phaseolina TaxID=35725 RepID=A0ABQ8GFJ0_9PEZI|nr:hypothetical protein B0J12DRAFT_452353 [Macrophomina phaseolina]